MLKNTDLFVDTSGWAYALDSQADEYAAVSNVIIGATRQNRALVTTNYIVAELVALLSTARFRISRQSIIERINAMKVDPNIEILHLDADTDTEAWKLLETRPDKEWSLVDASSFVVMQRFGLTEALTSDHHFTQAGFVRLPHYN